MRHAIAAVAVMLPACPVVAQPLADHHQHLFSPALAALISPAPPAEPIAPITARELIRHLDAAGIQRAAVLSTAYIFGQPSRKVAGEREKMRADNDWTSAQVAEFPDRLIGFCGISPLKDYALEELARCSKDQNLRRGLKLHFGNAVVDYHNEAHLEQLRRVFRAANDYRMAIVVHMRPAKLPYGRDEALIFLNEILTAAPDVTVQIAHLAGAGPGYEYPAMHQALQVFVEAIAKEDPGTARLWFDVTTVATATTPPWVAAIIASRIRELGVQRVLYGSDAAIAKNSPRAGWAAFRALPLTAAEFEVIANNVPPYMR
jgi:predicted TIM-barrel fold metal-dependent hydrolase